MAMLDGLATVIEVVIGADRVALRNGLHHPAFSFGWVMAAANGQAGSGFPPGR